VPTSASAIVEEQRARQRDLSALRFIDAGGAIAPLELVCAVRRELGAQICGAEGQTESSPLITT